ncbi:MAG: Na/Pi cotransporter family protein [Prevotella sp.]|nr:Na/Pi cotransporter family protein [Prevotella sp.]MBR3111894.1 Na/Pi cotransporter family protein [Prevotella sp.]
METIQDYVMVSLKLLGALGLLIFGMRMMSEALQKMAGPQLRHILARMTTNRLTGMLTGAFVTCAVQSSSATTVMTVSFVSAGLLTLVQAISVIMGANIGTTLTAWIMSLGYNVDLTNVVFPAFLVGIVLIYMKRYRFVGDFLFGIAFMFLSLVILSTTGKEMDLEHNEAVVRFFASFDTDSYWTILAFLGIGTVITCIVQSSAAVMAITILLCSTGVLPIYLGIALVMGENIGTTATANLAALGANTQARRAALAHLLFNVFGVVWVMCVFYPFVDMVCWLVGYDPSTGGQVERLPVVLAMFHTCFNVTNTAILIGLITWLERIVCWLLPEKPQPAEEQFRLQYIQANLMQTPEISVLQAQKETAQFGLRVQKMFGMVRGLMDEKNETQFVGQYSQIVKQEDYTDRTEIGIARFLEQVSENHLSDATKQKVRQMLREVGELESIGDACFNLARTLNRMKESGKDFTAAQRTHLQAMITLCDDALTQMNTIMTGHRHEHDISETYRIENDINQMRQRLKTDNIRAVDEHEYDYATGTLYIDFVNECEKLGDYVVNVVQARFGQ